MRIFHHLSVALVVCATLLLGLAGCQTAPVSSQTLVGSQAFNYALTGSEGPLLVFQSGLGDDRSTWSALLDRLPADQQAFTYDRPGYGASAATTTPRDPESIARELHGLLHQLGLPPPYVLVGHSMGGLYQYAFLKNYPDEVAGLVLIDPTHPDHWRRMQQDAPGQARLLKALRLTLFSAAARGEFDAQEGSPDWCEAFRRRLPRSFSSVANADLKRRAYLRRCYTPSASTGRDSYLAQPWRTCVKPVTMCTPSNRILSRIGSRNCAANSIAAGCRQRDPRFHSPR